MDAFVATYLREYFDLLYKSFDPRRDMTLRLSKGEVYVGPLRTCARALGWAVLRSTRGWKSARAQRSRAGGVWRARADARGGQVATTSSCGSCSATRP